jgi:uncharacterized membrane protein
MKTKKRILELDVLRGVAVILMVMFHFGFDLAEFGYASYQTTVDMEWKVFRAVVLSMFLVAVGMSAYVAYADGINYKKLIKNLAKLSLVSVMISMGSYVAFPHAWIYFGVIHFIVLALPLSLFFLHKPYLALLLGIAIPLSYILGFFPLDALHHWSVQHLHIPSFTVDVVSFTPWFGLVLLGVFLMSKNLFDFKLKDSTLNARLSFLGRHSLLIYLVHQPILFGGFYLLKEVL